MGFIKKVLKWFVIFFAGLFVLALIINVLGGNKEKDPSPEPVSPSPVLGGTTEFGSYFAPRNFPASFLNMQQQEIDEYFARALEIGDHTSVLMRWDEQELQGLTKQVLDQAKKKGLKVHIHLDPLTGWSHAEAAPPDPLKGRHFSDAEVRQAFINETLKIAAWKPDVLGIGTEVNLMLHEKNEQEFSDYVSLSKETYAAVKKKYPNQTVTLSFAWDVMRMDKQYEILSQFKDSSDIFSFTTYPNILSAPTPSKLPKNFFGEIRKYLPTQRIAISEIAFYSGAGGSEEIQSQFYAALPELLKEVKPEYVTQFGLYDIPSNTGVDERFQTFGLLKADGTQKKAWEVVRALKW